MASFFLDFPDPEVRGTGTFTPPAGAAERVRAELAATQDERRRVELHEVLMALEVEE